MQILESTTVDIPAPPELVFDFVADPRSEMVWNPRTRRVEKDSIDVVGLGSHFQGSWTWLGHLDVVVGHFERPRRSTHLASGRRLDYSVTDVVTATEDGSRLERSLWLELKGPWRVFGPLARPLLRRRLRKNGPRIREAFARGWAQAFVAAYQRWG